MKWHAFLQFYLNEWKLVKEYDGAQGTSKQNITEETKKWVIELDVSQSYLFSGNFETVQINLS